MRDSRTLTVVFVSLIAACFASPARGGENAASLRTKLAWQIALDRVGFSPGVIDGGIGHKTELATREFQRVRGLPITGKLDAATASALAVDPGGAMTSYTVQADDLAQLGPAPKGWLEKSRLPQLGYENLAAAVAERFHCSTGLLARLNPGRNLSRLQVGDSVVVPAVDENSARLRGDHLEIDLSEKVVRVLNRERQLVALLHCSIAKHRDKLPSGDASVVVITENPTYTFDPKMWPEVKGVDRKLLIPAGPRNPVGRCWIGLSLPGYGIHGSPNPELIGKTGSHGCFRLSNWDALRLARMIRVGTKVHFVGREAVADTLRAMGTDPPVSCAKNVALPVALRAVWKGIKPSATDRNPNDGDAPRHLGTSLENKGETRVSRAGTALPTDGLEPSTS
jgi:lipoprotein-anchoring transpeptidase ErfK/SrfK